MYHCMCVSLGCCLHVLTYDFSFLGGPHVPEGEDYILKVCSYADVAIHTYNICLLASKAEETARVVHVRREYSSNSSNGSSNMYIYIYIHSYVLSLLLLSLLS